MEGGQGTRLVLDPEEAGWRRWMHERYWQGWSCMRIAKYLNENGVPTKLPGGMWSDATVYGALRSPVQIGARVSEGRLTTGGNIEPLLDREDYERTLALMRIRNRHRGRVGSRAIPSRLVRCGNCGGPMQSSFSGGSPVYICRRRKLGACAHGVSIRYSTLEAYVEDRLFRHLAQGRAPHPRRHGMPELAPLQEELERVRDSLGRLAVLLAEGQIGEEEFQSARSLQRKRQERLEKRLEQLSARLEGDAREALLEAAWEDLGRLTMESWRDLSLQAKRDIYELVIAEIVVDAGGKSPEMRKPERRVRIRWR